MTKKIYTFSFDALKLSDFHDLIVATKAHDSPALLTIIAKCLPGLWDLPMTELQNVCTQFAEAVKRVMEDAVMGDAIRIIHRFLDERDRQL